MVIGIVGGGASGMAAALAAAENPGVQVVLFERQPRLGRKLQATGNGRCNLSNLHAEKQGYHGGDSRFVRNALAAFPPRETLDWFRDLGLLTVAEPSGKVYPYSDQANSVVDVLRFGLEQPNIRVLTECEVTGIRRQKKGFGVMAGEEEILCDRLVIACGGLAGTKLGGSVSGYRLLETMGHHTTRLRPSLVQIKCGWKGVTSLKGVRANCRVQIFHDEKCTAEREGELQFTEYGLSGPVIFEVSRDVCRGSGKWTARLDFLPQMGEGELFNWLQARRRSALGVEELLTGILHNRLGRVLAKEAGVRGGLIRELSDRELWAVCRLVKGMDVPLTDPMGMDSAQVTAGGVFTSEFDPATMESRLVKGLFACGEVLDIDGDCGGYNLQWAWSSGRLAGQNAGKDAR